MRTTTTVRVRYAETDQMGVAYHANYFVWFEVARCEWLRGQGTSYRDLEATGIRLPVIHAHCDYREPGRYDDEIDLRVRATLVSGVRVAFEYEAVRRAGGAVLATGRTVHAAINDGGRPCRLPERIRGLFA
jgi:acyl-CoA thioester hydrolase